MDVGRTWSVGFGDIDLIEIMNLNFEIAIIDLYVDDDLLIFGSSEGVSILLIRLYVICHDCVLSKFNLGVARLNVQ